MIVIFFVTYKTKGMQSCCSLTQFGFWILLIRIASCASFHLFKFFFVLCKRSCVSQSTLKIARLLVNYGGFGCKTKAMSKSLLEFHGKLLWRVFITITLLWPFSTNKSKNKPIRVVGVISWNYGVKIVISQSQLGGNTCSPGSERAKTIRTCDWLTIWRRWRLQLEMVSFNSEH